MTSGGRDRRAGVVLLVEEGLEGGDDDEFAVALDQALDELGPPAHADAGRGLGVGAGQGGDLMDLVGAQADQGRLSVQIDLDDDESLNRHIVEQALALAIQSNADLHLATVFDPLAAAEALPPLVPNLRPDQYASLSKGSRTAFDSFAADYGVPHPRRHFLLGTFKRSMRELTQHSQADVLVLGTAGHKGLEHLMLGGSARALLDHVRFDVYAVKPPALAEKLTQRIRDQASGPG